MKLDKETIIVLLIAALLAVSINPILQKLGLMQPAAVTNANQTTTKVQATTDSNNKIAQPTKEIKKDLNKKIVTQKVAKSIQKKIKFQSYTLQNNDVKVTIGNNGAVTEYNFLKFKKANSDESVSLNTSLNINKTSEAFNPQLPSEWQVKKIVKSNLSTSADSFELTRLFSSKINKNAKLLVTQKWNLEKNFQLKYNISFKNASNEQITIPEVKMMSIALLPTKQMTGDNARSEHFGVDFFTDKDDFISFRSKGDDDEFLSKRNIPAKWIAVSNKYFASIIKCDELFKGGIETFRKKYDNLVTDKKDDSVYKIAIEGNLGNVNLPSLNSSKEFKFNCFVGLKSLGNLKKFDKNTTKVVHLIGLWSVFNDIAIFMLIALDFLKNMLGNSYGWAIIALTLIVRAIFWPLTQKSNKSMKKMQALQPKIQEIREKYKDPQLQSAKTMELYRQEKVNPVGGCLPLFLQLPVFIALYWALDGAVDLRQASFGWAKDLAQPDTVAMLGPLAINPLVIIWAILMFVQQKLTPSAMDKNQQIIMYAMPVVMLFMLYGLPSGLTLYWTVSQVFSIVQMLINNRSSKKEEQATAKAS